MATLQAADGATLYLKQWPAPAGPTRGVVLIVHGLGEHIGRYADVASHLGNLGWAAVGFDHRGHGRSGGARGDIAGDGSLLVDLAQLIDIVRALHPGPLVLLGHSMGGVVAGRFVAEGLAASPARWWRPVDGLVMSSPALDPGMSRFQKGLLAVLGRLTPGLAVGNGLDAAWVSRDPAVVAAYQADGLVHNRVTPRLVRFIVDGGAMVRAAAPVWQVPTLLLYAGADRCVAPSGSAAFAASAPHGVLTTRCFDGLSHEIFNEPERFEVLSVLTDWLGSCVPERLLPS